MAAMARGAGGSLGDGGGRGREGRRSPEGVRGLDPDEVDKAVARARSIVGIGRRDTDGARTRERRYSV